MAETFDTPYSTVVSWTKTKDFPDPISTRLVRRERVWDAVAVRVWVLARGCARQRVFAACAPIGMYHMPYRQALALLSDDDLIEYQVEVRRQMNKQRRRRHVCLQWELARLGEEREQRA